MKKYVLIIVTLLILAVNCFAQCHGTNKDGKPCKAKAGVNKAGYCYRHAPGAIHCAKDSFGNIVKVRGEYCRVHKNNKS